MRVFFSLFFSSVVKLTRAVNANLAIAALRSLTLISVSALTSPISASVSAPR